VHRQTSGTESAKGRRLLNVALMSHGSNYAESVAIAMSLDGSFRIMSNAYDAPPNPFLVTHDCNIISCEMVARARLIVKAKAVVGWKKIGWMRHHEQIRIYRTSKMTLCPM
jgi:hypothetical protein